VCQVGQHANCLHVTGYDGCQAELIRVQNADGTLLATPEQPDEAMIPHLLALSDVMCTGWHAAVCAGVRPGSTVVVVGDGAVGLSGVLAAAQLGAERVIAMSRHADRQTLAREFGATDIVAERGEEGVERIKDLTGIGADAVLECVGTTTPSSGHGLRLDRAAWSAGSASRCHRPATQHMFWKNVGLRGVLRARLPRRPAGAGVGRVIEPGKGLRSHPPAGTGR
jgi:threonine dehydrogenase-like Zn-dependent dehydrogenase